MQIIDLLNNATIHAIVDEYNATTHVKKQAAYNLFTISSYNSYLENFHSDIIASLLDPKGLHLQGDSFLKLFIQFLNQYYNTAILPHNFNQAVVSRETGRLDIWIRDEKSRQSIIIENKINNATDMDDQIDRYFAYSESFRKYSVKAIVYLSLDGTKKAPPTTENLGHLVKNVGAFTNLTSDLLSGWLRPCFDDASNMDSRSFIYQYIYLLKHLANKNMETHVMEQFYHFLSTHNGMSVVNAISDMRNKITTYRADMFANAITDFSPFKKSWRYRQNYWIYENYRVAGSGLKLDIWFEVDGSAYVGFWNPSSKGIQGRQLVKDRLEAVNLLNEFEPDPSLGGNGYRKAYKVGEVYNSMSEIDYALVKFVKTLLKDLKNMD